MSRGVGHDWNNLKTLEERQIQKEVALYSFKLLSLKANYS